MRADPIPGQPQPTASTAIGEWSFEWDGRLFAQARSPGLAPGFPTLDLLDAGWVDGPKPLCQLSLDTGRLLEVYRWAGQGHRYLVPHGFQVPQLEVRTPGVLAHELAAGTVAYGVETVVSIPLSPGGHGVTDMLARLRNRIAANVFQQLLPDGFASPGAAGQAARDLIELNHKVRRNAPGVTDAVHATPTLAGVLRARRSLPWDAYTHAAPTAPLDKPALQRLAQARLREADQFRLERHAATGLIPTSPGTTVEPYVDTVAEAALIQLAVRVRDVGLARDLLSFYWTQTRGGTKWVHASYDARTGAARQPDPDARRPLHSRRTAEAQVALAEAAFLVWSESGDPKGFVLGSNLLARLCVDFRGAPLPRGISEHPVPRPHTVLGFRLWPPQTIYTTRSNARTYLLLRQLTDRGSVMRPHFSETDWDRLVAARVELEAWLKNLLLPHVRANGVVPQGLLEVRDVERGATAMAAERWTTTEDWLRFLEVAPQLGVDPATARRWLEHLARVHGTSIHDRWGMDWTLALSRPDMISTELTARFWRVARDLGHPAAANHALRQLQTDRLGEAWPAVWSLESITRPVATGTGEWIWPMAEAPGSPGSLLALGEMLSERAVFSAAPIAAPPAVPHDPEMTGTDVGVFLALTVVFYGSILGVALFWTAFRWSRLRWRSHLKSDFAVGAVPDRVIVLAEERWASRVLGVIRPPHSHHSRYSNATLESNFQMQLRAIHKLVIEWRRREHDWAESARALVEDDSDEWLNGLDEFCSLVAIYMRWVIKAGAKDGFRKADLLQEHEDGNHIWSRLVLYFAEYHWALLTLLRAHGTASTPHARTEVNAQITLLLNAMGLRQRRDGFDARTLFDAPANPDAFDLLLLQQPGTTLARVIEETDRRLRIPSRHFLRFIRNYKQFKDREQPYPLHPFLIESGKVLPHFLLMALGALIFYNHYTVGDGSVVRYLWDHVLLAFVFVPEFRYCGLILGLGLALTCMAHWIRVYRWEAAMVPRATPEFPLDRALTALMPGRSIVLPLLRPGRRWNPVVYQRAAWTLRALGCFWLGTLLLGLPTPSFVTFLVVKGILAMLAFAEAASILIPAFLSCLGRFLQEWVGTRQNPGAVLRLLHQLNLTVTLPSSLLWQSIRFHFRPSAPSGTPLGRVQAMVAYFLLAALFFGGGVFLCQEMLPLWFSEKYRAGEDLKLLAGGALFWFTMYLFRYGLFLLVAGAAAWMATFPLKALAGALAAACLLAGLLGAPADTATPTRSAGLCGLGVFSLALLLFEQPLVRRLPRVGAWCQHHLHRPSGPNRLPAPPPAGETRLAVVYMSGDALSAESLTPELLLSRWQILRDRLGSPGLRCFERLSEQPGEEELLAAFRMLHAAELHHGVTLWHPLQIVLEGRPPQLPVELGLNLTVKTAGERERVLKAWQWRRWLATMMSTAGHSQDTGINLVDIALRLEREGLAARTAFYLIQNKYDATTGNRPAQTPYDRGELGQRDQLARLLCALAPGARAYNLQNWTPFGFKAGALTSMDLVPEESLRLTSMLILDRNATVNDLDGLMADIREAMNDPNLVIVIPGRGTTNTRTSLGQASQMVEEGHRSFLRGLIRVLGGNSSECLGTGWGNLMAYGYGEVQRALLNVESPLMPLTSRMRRGTSFRLRLEGLIGFGPHAVGISEDTWAVAQATHNAVALGRRVRFAGSRAFWHKLRETWSHAEWLSSFPRWSGGYLQMMHDPLMQRINDFGPLSLFARELRACSGRFYLSALVTLLNILLLPLAIFLDVTPFVQILIVLWNVGFVINQVLTVHSLLACLESAGFHRAPALGTGFAASLTAAVIPELRLLAPACGTLGFLLGGFGVGLGRWLATRLRDVILFGPQLVLHALGQCFRQALEFTMSGASPHDARGVNMAFRTWAGPREDRPLAGFTSPVNLQVVVWGVGMISLGLNLVALSRLDLLNVLMLLPSLLFSVSALIGPFLMTPLKGAGQPASESRWKLLGWLGAIALYVIISRLLTHPGLCSWVGLALFLTPPIMMARHALRFAAYRPLLRRARTRLTRLLLKHGLPAPGAAQATERLMSASLDQPAGIDLVLDRCGLSPEARQDLRSWIEIHLRPLLRAPLAQLDDSGRRYQRSRSLLARSFVLAWFVLLWFFLVPIPGLFVVSAGAYQIATRPGSTLLLVLGLAGGALVLAAAGKAWLRFLHRPAGRRGLVADLERAHRRFEVQSLARSGQPADPGRTAELHGLFLSALLYLDQGADAYARTVLGQILNRLDPVPESHGA